MKPNETRKRLESVLAGKISRESFCEWFLNAADEPAVPNSAEEKVPCPAEENSPELQVDLDRPRRCGFGEVVYGEGKSPKTVLSAIRSLHKTQPEVLVTRACEVTIDEVQETFPYVSTNREARTIRIGRDAAPLPPEETSDPDCRVGVISAGTTDNGVLQEAVETLAWMKIQTYVAQDAGVAGPYRLPRHLPELRKCVAVIVIAGMEGALPSVVGGHLAQPIIAVPTSVGYGASFNGLAALLSMINSCSANVTTVNIDGGFCGAFVAGAIVNQIRLRVDSNSSN